MAQAHTRIDSPPAGDALSAVQQNTPEQPGSSHALPPVERELVVGDRIIIRQGRRSFPELLNRTGTIVEIFRVPRDSCLVRLDGDTDRQREWFCYHDEVVQYTAAQV